MGEIVNLQEKRWEAFLDELREADFQDFKDTIINILRVFKSDIDNAEHNFGVILEQLGVIAATLLLSCVKTSQELGKPLSQIQRESLAEQLGLEGGWLQ